MKIKHLILAVLVTILGAQPTLVSAEPVAVTQNQTPLDRISGYLSEMLDILLLSNDSETQKIDKVTKLEQKIDQSITGDDLNYVLTKKDKQNFIKVINDKLVTFTTQAMGMELQGSELRAVQSELAKEVEKEFGPRVYNARTLGDLINALNN